MCYIRAAPTDGMNRRPRRWGKYFFVEGVGAKERMQKSDDRQGDMRVQWIEEKRNGRRGRCSEFANRHYTCGRSLSRI